MLPFPAIASTHVVEEQVDRLASTAEHYTSSSTPEATATRMKLIFEAQELVRSLTSPADQGSVHIAQAMELVAVRTLLHLKAFHHIPPNGSITLKALAVATKAQASLLERLLRILICVGFIRQLDNQEYAHTKFSLAYATIPGPGMQFQLIYDESFLMLDNFHLYLDEKGYKEPDNQRYSPYAWKSKQEGTPIYDIMAQHPERLHAFHAGLAHFSETTHLTGFYDFGKLNVEGDRTILVDVGGGAGHSIMRILGAHPQIPSTKCILQDLKGPIVQSKIVLPTEVRAMEHDFFKPQPIEGAKAYLLRFIMHDFSDAVCVNILKKIALAMAPDSLLLISDFCLPELVTERDLPAVTMDITILNMGGKERSEGGFREILNAAGLELFKTYHAHVGFGTIIEARLA